LFPGYLQDLLCFISHEAIESQRKLIRFWRIPSGILAASKTGGRDAHLLCAQQKLCFWENHRLSTPSGIFKSASATALFPLLKSAMRGGKFWDTKTLKTSGAPPFSKTLACQNFCDENRWRICLQPVASNSG